VSDLGFEYKRAEEGLDLGVLVKSGDRTEYGVQLKDMDHAHGISSAGKTIVKKHLFVVIDGPKVAILDVHDIKAALTEKTLKGVEYYASKTNSTWGLRFEDVSVIVPASGQVYP
jgi:hypothetical protein